MKLRRTPLAALAALGISSTVIAPAAAAAPALPDPTTIVPAAKAQAFPFGPGFATAPAPGAVDDGTVTVGPGSPIRVPIKGTGADENGIHVETGMCSLGVPGTLTDPATGESKEVILTAGHCIVQTGEYAEAGMPQMSDTAYFPGKDGDVPLGTVDAWNFDASSENGANFLDASFNAPDWAVLELAPGMVPTRMSDSVDENGKSHGDAFPVTHIEDKPTLAPGQVSMDNLGERICTDGTRTGRQCGYQVFRARNGVWAVLIRLDHGDSGGSAYNPDTGAFIGVNSMAIGPFNRIQPADVAIEQSYDVPDGQVNDYFKVAEGSRSHSEGRTIGDDVDYANKKAAEEAIGSIGDLIPLPGSVAAAPEAPKAPVLPELPAVPATAQELQVQINGAVDQVLGGAGELLTLQP